MRPRWISGVVIGVAAVVVALVALQLARHDPAIVEPPFVSVSAQPVLAPAPSNVESRPAPSEPSGPPSAAAASVAPPPALRGNKPPAQRQATPEASPSGRPVDPL